MSDISEIIGATHSLDIATNKSDTVDLSFPSRAIHANISGNLVCILTGESDTKTFYLLAGNLYPYRCKRILASSTVTGYAVA